MARFSSGGIWASGVGSDAAGVGMIGAIGTAAEVGVGVSVGLVNFCVGDFVRTGISVTEVLGPLVRLLILTAAGTLSLP